jgi:hypothetical protein
VRISSQRPRRNRSSDAIARTRSLVLSSVFKERLALLARALEGLWCRFRRPVPVRIGRAGRGVNLAIAPQAVNLRAGFLEVFFRDAR